VVVVVAVARHPQRPAPQLGHREVHRPEADKVALRQAAHLAELAAVRVDVVVQAAEVAGVAEVVELRHLRFPQHRYPWSISA
jgi:hypothetical protein